MRFARHEAMERRRDEARGFTIIELIVVIGIIVLLAAITVTVSVQVVGKSEARQTANVIQLLDMALQEWEVSADRKIGYGPGPQFDIDTSAPVDPGEDPFDHQFHLLLTILNRNDNAREILGRIDPSFLLNETDPTTGEEVLTVEDAWGRGLWVVFPGPVSPLATTDADGTEQTFVEQTLGTAVNRAICFVSAGPDGEFGDQTQPDGDPARVVAEDNIYSYQVIKP